MIGHRHANNTFFLHSRFFLPSYTNAISEFLITLSSISSSVKFRFGTFPQCLPSRYCPTQKPRAESRNWQKTNSHTIVADTATVSQSRFNDVKEARLTVPNDQFKQHLVALQLWIMTIPSLIGAWSEHNCSWSNVRQKNLLNIMIIINNSNRLNQKNSRMKDKDHTVAMRGNLYYWSLNVNRRDATFSDVFNYVSIDSLYFICATR